VQHRSRVGGVADHDKVGLVRHPHVRQTERRIEHDVPNRNTSPAQRDVRFGERRRDHRRQRRTQVGQQGESLGGAGQQRDLVGGPAVPGGDCLNRSVLVIGARVSSQVG
jgi:hypothetical protein